MPLRRRTRSLGGSCFVALFVSFVDQLSAGMVDKAADLNALPQVPPGFEVKLVAFSMPGFATLLSPRQCADLAVWLLAQKAGAAGRPPAGEVKPAEKAQAQGSHAAFAFESRADRLVITLAGAPFGEFVFRHDKVLRPFFANVRAPGGVQVTRNFPPIAGTDAMDHDTMHPGISLGFGDLSGNDFWRNRAAIRHERFSEAPAVRDGRLTFVTESTMLAESGAAIGKMVSRFTLTRRPEGVLLVWDTTITPAGDGFHFGDQEEMGFAVRVATPIAEKSGGGIASSTGAKGAKATWGQPAAWCDYSGVIGGQRVGVAIFPDPKNFRPSWWHNRDYGVFVANPFGQKAMKQGEKSIVEVKRGEPFRLRFGALLHSTPAESRLDLPASYAAFKAMRAE